MLGFLKKSATFTVNQLAGVVGWFGYSTASGVAVNAYTALDNTAVFCGCRVIAEGIGQMPVRIITETFDRNTGLPTLKVNRDHWAYKLLAIRPNSWQTSYEFREGMIFNAVIGEGAIAIKNTVRGKVLELLPVPAGSWTVEHMPDWSLRIRVDYADKTHGYFDQSQIFYIRGPSMDGFSALPAFRQAREAIGLSHSLERQQAKLASNGGKPSGVLSFDQPLAQDTKEKLRKSWELKFGAGGEGGIAVLDGAAKFYSMTMTSVDAQFLETRRLQVEEVARALRVQPIMMMQADKAATFASAEQMFRNHVIHTLGPWIERFEQAANRDILGNADGLRVDLDERNLLRGDFKDQAEYYVKALGAGGAKGWMSQDEIRAEVGLNPLGTAESMAIAQGAMEPKSPMGGQDGTA